MSAGDGIQAADWARVRRFLRGVLWSVVMAASSACSSIYLDNQATTQADPRVVAAMLPFWSEAFGNPHSVEHSVGWAADEAIERARGCVASAIGADAGEVVFTSGATEANNIAILGSARAAAPNRRRIVVSAIEHRCVLAAAAAAAREGFEVVAVPVGPEGLVRMDELAQAVDSRTALVSVMLANNEVGTIQPIADIADLCRSEGALLHTDAAQGLAAMRIDVDALGADLLSLSSHKVYGPMGVGALFVRRGIHTRPEPIMHGGGQERGLRPGTLPTPLCIGFGASCRIMEAEGGGRPQTHLRPVGRLAGWPTLLHPRADCERRCRLAAPRHPQRAPSWGRRRGSDCPHPAEAGRLDGGGMLLGPAAAVACARRNRAHRRRGAVVHPLRTGPVHRRSRHRGCTGGPSRGSGGVRSR